MLLATIGLLFCQSPGSEAELRKRAWEIHSAPQPTAAIQALRTQIASPTDLLDLARAASRAVADDPILTDLLLELSEPPLDSLPTNLVPPWSQAQTDLLLVAHETDQGRRLALELLQRPELHDAALATLLRWQVAPTAAGTPYYQALLQALASGWLPTAGQFQLFGDLLRSDPELRSSLLENHLGRPLSGPSLQILVAADKQGWSSFDTLAASVLRLDSGIRDPDQVRRLWSALVAGQLAPGRWQRLAEALQRHILDLPPAEVERAWVTADPPARHRILELLRDLPSRWGHDLRLQVVHDSDADADLRAAWAEALLREGGPDTAEEMRALLDPRTPRKVLRSVLHGLRWNLPADFSSTLTALIPRLRTEEAVIAVELCVRIADQETRLAWLRRLAPLPPNARKQILQIAWYSHPEEELVDLFREFADSPRSAERELARVGLEASLDEKGVAAFYRARLDHADLAVQAEAMEQLRLLGTDAALAALVDWLPRPAGRLHPRSADYASLLVDEEQARPAMEAWWQEPSGLSESQLDWAASNLAPVHPSARERLWSRMDQVPARTGGMFLSRLQQGATAEDLNRFAALLADPTGDAYVRRIAARIVVEALPDSAPQCLDLLPQLLAAHDAEPTVTASQVAWSVWLRGIASRAEPELLTHFQRWIETQSWEDPWQLPRTWLIGIIERTPQDQMALARERVLAALTTSSLSEWNPYGHPNAKEISDHGGQVSLWMEILGRGSWSANEDTFFAEALHGQAGRQHPDLLFLLHAALQNQAPESRQTCEKILLHTEAPSSFRRPQPKSPPPQLALRLWTEPNAFFQEARRTWEQGDRQFLDDALEAARMRWPADRRSHLWSGWNALAEGNWIDAEIAFGNAQHLSGLQPYPTLEPRLGLACTHALEAGDAAELLEFLRQDSRSLALLKGRLRGDAIPQLDAWVRETANTSGQD